MKTYPRLPKGFARPGVVALLAIACLAQPVAASGGRRTIAVADRSGRTWVPPVFETRVRSVPVPAEYETRMRRVWIEPVYELRRVWVESHHPRKRPKHRRLTALARLLGPPGVRRHLAARRGFWQETRVLVREGFYETIRERVLIRPSTMRLVRERVLVRAGYWRLGRHATNHPARRGGRTIRATYDPTANQRRSRRAASRFP